MTWRVTHVDHQARRRQIEVDAERSSDAQAQAEQLLGAALYLAVIALRRLP